MSRSSTKILLAEDAEDQARILQAVLKQGGFDVTWMNNGAEAYTALQTGDYDLLITDISMPGMTGFELIDRLKSENRLPATIVLTGKQGDEDVLRGLEGGAMDYINKPFSPSVVLARVRLVLKNKKLYEPEL